MWATVLALLILVFSQSYGQGPIVLTAQGPVQGFLSSDGQSSAFLGIPFATVNPDNPFGDALPGPIFNEVFEANDDSARCPQSLQNVVVGNLDCLQVNVHVPTTASPTDPLPVMVFIYGGGFRMGYFGSAQYGPENIISHDVIFVSLNYRLGPYGFMCLDIPSVPGNTGLKDQQAGLRWVNENIAAFGGDVNSITVFAQSAGAISLHFQIISPGSNGLFHRAILQSGTALVEEVIVHSRPTDPLVMVNHLGFDAQSVEEALDIMKEIPSDDVIRTAMELGLKFNPCIETSFDGVENMLVTYPDITLESGQYESVPMLIGYNSHEQLGRYLDNRDNNEYFEQIRNIFYDKTNASFAFDNEDDLETIAKIFQEFYIGSKPVSNEVLFELGDFDSDAHFVHPIERAMTYHLEKADQPFYQYLFAYSGGLNSATDLGALHSGELPYLFKMGNSPDVLSSDDLLMVDRLTTMWTNFAKYGDPTPETSALLPVRWPAATQDSRDYLHIDNDLVIDQKPFHDRMAFWDLFFLAYREYLRMVWD